MMQEKKVMLPGRSVPVINQADIIVCGGGPSGITAAIAAARLGARVILVEKQIYPGGMATGALVNPVSEFNHAEKPLIRGIPWELMEEIHALGGARIDAPSGNVHMDPELYKLAAQRMLLNAGVHLYLNSHILDCVRDGRGISHVIFDCMGTSVAVGGAYFIDATGNAGLCAAADVPMQENGPGVSPQLQPASLCFRLDGVDTEQLENTFFARPHTKYANSRVRELLQKLARDGDVPNFGGPWFSAMERPGSVLVNMTRSPLDPEDPGSVARASCRLREDMFRFIEILRESVPGFRDCRLGQSAPELGIRESRCIKGLYTLSGEDLLQGKWFEDTIAKTSHPVDIHRPGDSLQDVTFLDKPGNIPFRCLVPEAYDNLLAAGRSISADRTAFASLRVQAPVMAIGQAAGAAAALACRGSIPVQNVEAQELRRVLQEQGALV